MILQSQQPAIEPSREYEVGFATRAQGPSKGFVLQVRIPRGLLAELGDPKRIMIAGTPHQGYTIKPTTDRSVGLAVTYKGAVHFVFMTAAFRPTKLTKIVRRLTVANARVVEGVIRVGGMPDGWIKGAPGFIDGGMAAPPSDHHRVAASPITGTVPQPNGNGRDQHPPQVADDMTVQQITGRLDAALREAAAMKAALEKKTGLSFRVSQDMRLVLSPTRGD